MVVLTRHFLPYLELIFAPSGGMHGRTFLVDSLDATLWIDDALPRAEKYAAIAAAVNELWRTRHVAGIGDYEHRNRPRLRAV